MLSIGAMGKAGGDAGAYYMDLAKEDYYLACGEPLGQWRSHAATALGLEGPVERSALRAVLEGVHPTTGSPWCNRPGRHIAPAGI